jgi:glycosyltransferase involved in cell wall biosynthesis
MTYQISVIIPVYNDYKRLDLCLNALVHQNNPVPFEILVVDNGSKDIDQAVVEKYIEYSYIRFINEPKPGSYAARNKGISESKAGIIAFTDGDCIPEPSWLANIMKVMSQGKVDLIAGNVEIFFESTQTPPSLLEIFELVLAFPQKENAKVGRSVTANVTVKKHVIDAIGNFQDDSFSGADYEFTSRAVKNGFTLVYGEHCTVKHPARKHLSEMRQKLRRVVGGYYKLRDEDPVMAKQLSWRSILENAAPPIFAWKVTQRRKKELNLSNIQQLKVIIVATHNKWYRLFLKLKLKLGLTSFIER